jgi:hypothetical protein
LTSHLELKSLSWKNAGSNGVVKAALTGAQTAQLDTFTQLFVGGIPAIRAQFPNKDSYTGFKYSLSKAKKWGKGKQASLTKLIRRVGLYCI